MEGYAVSDMEWSDWIWAFGGVRQLFLVTDVFDAILQVGESWT